MSVIQTSLAPLATATETMASIYTASTVIGVAKQSNFYFISGTELYYGYHLSLAGNSVFLAVFSAALISNFALGLFYRQWWVLVFWTLGLTLEVIGYAGRIWSCLDITNINPFIMQSVCIAIGPSYFMTGAYYILAQMVTIFGQQYSILKPMMYSYVFILVGAIASALQGAGGGVSASGNLTTGARLLIAGLSLQVLITGAFIFFWSHFMWSVRCSYKTGVYHFNPNYSEVRKRKAFALMIGSIPVMAILVCGRTVYRLVEFIEFEKGYGMKLAYNEHFFLTFESLLICLAAIIMVALHPGTAYGRGYPIYINRRGIDRLEKHNNQNINIDTIASHTEKPFV